MSIRISGTGPISAASQPNLKTELASLKSRLARNVAHGTVVASPIQNVMQQSDFPALNCGKGVSVIQIERKVYSLATDASGKATWRKLSESDSRAFHNFLRDAVHQADAQPANRWVGSPPNDIAGVTPFFSTPVGNHSNDYSTFLAPSGAVYVSKTPWQLGATPQYTQVA